MNDKQTPEETDRMNREADMFAMSLLMPAHMVRREWEKMTSGQGHSEDHIMAMAALFEVSQIRMTIRLKDMKLIL